MSSQAKRIFLSPPHMCGEELSFVRQAFESNYIAPLGPQVDAFEREFCEKTGIGHAVAVSSGTAAMHLALRNLGIRSGDEVIASTLTFIGSVTPILFHGGIPVFIDSDRVSWNMDPDLLAAELESCYRRERMPKAVVPTDLYGQCVDLERIKRVCDRYEVPLIMDSAESLGAQYKLPENSPDKNNNSAICDYVHAGVGAKAAVFSFNGNKIITTSGGGMLASDDALLIERARFLSQQARDPAPHYEHSRIGYNYRMSNIAAAIGRGQLQVLDTRVEQKRAIFTYYRDALANVPGIEFMPEARYGRSTRWLTVILIDPDEFGADRESVRLALESENIECRPLWKPMHLQPVFRMRNLRRESPAGTPGKMGKDPAGLGNEQYEARIVGGTVSESLFERGLCLPSGTQLTRRDQDRIIGIIKRLRGTKKVK